MHVFNAVRRRSEHVLCKSTRCAKCPFSPRHFLGCVRTLGSPDRARLNVHRSTLVRMCLPIPNLSLSELRQDDGQHGINSLLNNSAPDNLLQSPPLCSASVYHCRRFRDCSSFASTS